MTWTETNPVEQRERFIRDLSTGAFKMSSLCERYGVSRKTGYKWRGRHHAEGLAGLKDRSRAPHTCPHRMQPWARELLLNEKRLHRNWGAPKLREFLLRRNPSLELPAASSIGELFKREGLTKPRRRKKRWKHPGAPVRRPTKPNELWTADFKGQFKTRDGVYCYPLTVADQRSRYLLACKALSSVKTAGATELFTRLFREHGMPDAIRSDNGVPFCSPNALVGLSKLNAWWLELGIHHERTRPASPQDNGAHERMHRTLKRDTTRPPASSMRGQQRKFDNFRHEYNEDRPHDFLDGKAPADVYEPSPRPFPKRVPKPDYPEGMYVRKVSSAGTFRLKRMQPFISAVLWGKYIALEEVDDGLWAVYFHQHLLAHYDEHDQTWLD
jgi:transposase InsO family protein